MIADLHGLNTRALDWVVQSGVWLLRSGGEVVGKVFQSVSGDPYIESANGRWFIRATPKGYAILDGESGQEVGCYVRQPLPVRGALRLPDARTLWWTPRESGHAWLDEHKGAMMQFVKDPGGQGRLRLEQLDIVADPLFPLFLLLGVYLEAMA